VTWTNEDAIDHTATGSGFDTEPLGTGESSTITFDTAGTFAYVCSIHPTMTGSIVVEAAGGAAAPITPAPTDTLEARPAEDPAASAVTIALAAAGIVMLVGTFVADRRFRRRVDEA